jgi:dTDP-4-dehydrorhamnose reductase
VNLKTLILGANGQLGQALSLEFPDAEQVTRQTLDLSDPSILTARNWQEYGLILNAAAYTAVDLAETEEGRIDAWRSNATTPGYLSQISRGHDITVVHISSDYVFDGTKQVHTEDEPFSPLGVYGQSKAAGDIAISTAERHYILRTSWVIGEGKNFIQTMQMLAEKGVKPSVVNDQIGRLTFTTDLAKAIKHLVENNAPYGTYNLTNDGESVSWAEVASLVYEQVGHNRDEVTGVSTAEYYAGKDGIAPRPLQSTLDLGKIKAKGFEPRRWETALNEYLKQQS